MPAAGHGVWHQNPPERADAALLLPGVRSTRLVRSARAARRSVGLHRQVCMCRKPLGSIVLAGVGSPVPASAARGVVQMRERCRVVVGGGSLLT